jgi:hypothetical protein
MIKPADYDARHAAHMETLLSAFARLTGTPLVDFNPGNSGRKALP